MDKSYLQFLAVALHGSISAAANELNVTQPTLTTSIRKLEAQFGVPLFIRKSKGVELTEYGELFKEKALEITQCQQNLLAKMSDLKARRTQKVKMGTGDAWWALFIKEVVFKYSQINPSISIELEFGNHLKLMDLLQKGQIDLFMGHEIIGLSKRYPVTFIPIFQDEEAWYVKVDHPLLLSNKVEEEAENYPLLRVTPDSHAYQHLLEDSEPKRREAVQKGVDERIVYSLGSLSASLDLLRALPAIMPYPAKMARFFAEEGIVALPKIKPNQRATVGVYYRAEQSIHIERLLTLIKTQAAKSNEKSNN